MRALSQSLVFDSAIPAHAVAALRTDIIASPPKSDGTQWYAFGPPRFAFEQTIQHLRRLVPGDFAGAEWWYRATTTDAGFPFHFDRDEGIRSSVVPPTVTSILYLSNAGGPTVFLDATPTRSTPSAGIAVHPRAGRFIICPGALLHGVLPVPSSRWPRVTMLINWWRSVPRMEPAAAQRGWTRASGSWRAKPRPALLDAIDPTDLMTKAAWRDLIRKQATYR
jgi:hypothetical protein